jgi:hypothetical protein
MTTDPHPAIEDGELIAMAAATLLEVDQQQFEEAFELLVRCRTRDLLHAYAESARADHRLHIAVHRGHDPAHQAD